MEYRNHRLWQAAACVVCAAVNWRYGSDLCAAPDVCLSTNRRSNYPSRLPALFPALSLFHGSRPLPLGHQRRMEGSTVCEFCLGLVVGWRHGNTHIRGNCLPSQLPERECKNLSAIYTKTDWWRTGWRLGDQFRSHLPGDGIPLGGILVSQRGPPPARERQPGPSKCTPPCTPAARRCHRNMRRPGHGGSVRSPARRPCGTSVPPF